ncbi:MAG: FecR domain-containing protein, partial [Gemmatimonadaceae bacterium]
YDMVSEPDPEGGTTVAVTQGSVLVARAGAPDSSGTVLRQGDVGAIAADGRVTARRGVVLDRELAWTRGRLVFRDTPLAEVAVALRRWYGVDVRFAEPLLSARHWTAEFDAGTSLADVLRVMELGIGGITVERSDSVVVIGTRASTGGMTR